MFKYFIKHSELIKPTIIFFIFCLIYFIQNKLFIPLNTGDLNFPHNTLAHLEGVMSTFNSRAFFGFENSREISSFVYAVIIHFLSFFFKNNYYITNFLILSGFLTSLICIYLYLKNFNLNQNNAILISFFWILNPIFIFIFSQLYFGANIYLYLFLFFDVLIINKIIKSDNVYTKIIFILIYYFSPTNISFNNPALFITYIPAVIFLLSLLGNFKFRYYAEVILLVLFANLLHIYAIYNLIFGGTIGEASNELFIANTNIQVMKESMASFFDAISLRGLWVTSGRIYQDFYNPYHYFFISPIYIVITYIPFTVLIVFCIKYIFKKDTFNTKINISFQKFTYILTFFFLFVYVNSLHSEVIELLNFISPGFVQAFRTGMQKTSILIVIVYLPILIYSIQFKITKILIVIFLLANLFFLIAGNIYKHTFLQWPGSYFEIPSEYLNLIKNENLNKKNVRYLSVPYNTDPNIEITKENFSYSGSDFKFNLLNSSNVMHGNNEFFINYAKYIFGISDVIKIKKLINYFNINYIINHQDISPILIGINPNGLKVDDSYLKDFDLITNTDYFDLYKTNQNTNFFSIKTNILKIKNYTEINELNKDNLYVNTDSNFKNLSINTAKPDFEELYDISKLTAYVTIDLNNIKNESNLVIHMTHSFSNYWKLQIENIKDVGSSNKYFYHSRDVFGLNYWVFDIQKYCKFNDCNDNKSLKLKIYYENFIYLKMLILFLSLFGPIIFYILKKILINYKFV